MTGTLPGRGAAPPHGTHSPPSAPGAGRWDEEEIGRIAEDAARHAPAVSEPAATVRIVGGVAHAGLDVVVAYGAHLPTVAEGIRRRVVAGIEARTGLTVEAVTVTVVDLRLPGGPASGRAVVREAT